MFKKALVGFLIILWLLAMLGGLWWYKSKYIRSAVFLGDELQLPKALANSGRIQLVHFWIPACPCNLGNQQHLAEITRNYADTVDFYHIQKTDSKGQLPKNLQALKPLADLQGIDTIPASPAVAIWDSQGNLAYLGPYSEGAICTSSNSFVEPVLDALKQGRSVRSGSSVAVGCFCDW